VDLPQTKMMDADLDKTLVARAKKGSTAAFDQLVRRHQDPVRAFLRRIVSDPSFADDLAQDTFLKAWQRLTSWHGLGRQGQGTSFRGWLYTIAANTAKDAWRSSNRARLRDTLWQEQRGAAPDPEASAGAKLDLDRVLQTLSREQRLVVALCYGAGMSHAQAAHALKMPLGTVKSHALRGRDRALELMKDLNPSPLAPIIKCQRIAS
jgi:RNA polymerase sigma factor (sigma-70 family)